MSNFGGASFLNPNKTDYTSLVAPGVTGYWRNLGADKLYGSMEDAARIKADAETDYYKKVMKARAAADSAGDAPEFAGKLLSAGLGVAGMIGDAGGFEFGKTKMGAGGGSVGGIGTYGPNYGFPTW